MSDDKNIGRGQLGHELNRLGKLPEIEVEPVAEARLVRIEMEYANGKVTTLEGEEAQRWIEAANGAVSMSTAHGFPFPKFDWQITIPKTGCENSCRSGKRVSTSVTVNSRPHISHLFMCRLRSVEAFSLVCLVLSL